MFRRSRRGRPAGGESNGLPHEPDAMNALGVALTGEGRLDEAEPAWDDPTHSGTVTLPAEWVFTGKAGWYAGHIQPGGAIGMSDLRTATWEFRTDP